MIDQTAPEIAGRRYFEHLDVFVELCLELVERGMPYMAVLLCHELFRFLYPVEPYAGFVNDRDPVADAETRIQRLLDVGRSCLSAVTPYPLNFTDSGAEWRVAGELARTTSNLYSELWTDFDKTTLTEEATRLVSARIPRSVIDERIKGRRVLDMGCGSGRYTLALAQLGAAPAIGLDVQAKSFAAAAAYATESGLHAEFQEGDVLNLPFTDGSFDFVFCNGVIHHSASISRGLSELARVLKPEGAAFLYLYAAGGIFWRTRVALRAVFKAIPLAYTKSVLAIIGMPSNRFFFCDTWYVPTETHTTTEELHHLLDSAGFVYHKLPGRNAFDLDGVVESASIPGARLMWGDGEHRYLLERTRLR